MSEVIINNVKFKNVPDKRYGTKIGDLLTQSNVGMSQTVAEYMLSDDFYALVNGVDIDWNGIEVEEGLELNTTADLINWIKTKGGGSAVEQIQSDWNQQDSTKKDYIKNKPVIPKPVDAYTKEEVNTLLDGKMDTTLKGAKNGVASLDSTGKVPASQLPGYVDDVIEGYKDADPLVELFDEERAYMVGEIVSYNGNIYRYIHDHVAGAFDQHEVQMINRFPQEGESGKIYSDIITNKTYRWSGSAYTQIKGDIVIGTTTGTAFDGAAGAALQTQVGGMATQVAGKVDKETGKGLSTNDYTNEDKTKVAAALTQHQDISGKVDKIAGKGLSTNDYTNEEKQKVADALVPADIAGKANTSDVYTKSETYSKTEVNDLITTPNQQYVSVTATAQTTAVTDLLPATGAADTIYRIGNWDGTQYNDSVYSEYAWNGSAYIKLNTKSQVGEVYDISANHANTKYADLTAALGTNGANIPQSLQKGGMSIKFVQSSDNNYVQYRLKNRNWSIVPGDWEKIDEPQTLMCPRITIINGKYIAKDGSTVDNVYFSITDYIEVNAGDTITFKNTVPSPNNQQCIAYYDGSKTFVDYFRLYNYNIGDVSFTIPYGVKYIRTSICHQNQDGFYFSINPVSNAAKIDDSTILGNRIGYINNTLILNGDEVANAYFVATSYIQIYSTSQIEIYNTCNSYSACSISFYDSDKVHISSINLGSQPNGVYQPVIPANARYMRTQAYKPLLHLFYISINNESLAFENNEIVKTLLTHNPETNYIDRNVDLWVKDAIIDGNGNVQTGVSGFYASPFFKVNAGVTYYHYRVHNGYYAFYDADKNVIEAHGNDQSLNNPFITPSGAAYMRITVLNAIWQSSCWVFTSNAEPPVYKEMISPSLLPSSANKTFCDYDGNEIATFNKIACVGDSLTEGAFNHNEGGTMQYLVDTKYAYPAYLKKISGVDCVNLGISGVTSAGWYNHYKNDDLSGYDCVIIQLGVNDAIQNQGWTQESIDAFTNIINKFKTDNNGIKIFIATIIPSVAYVGQSHTAVSEGIRDLVEDLADDDIVLLDMAEYGNTGDSAAYNAGHLTAFGYYRLAQDYKGIIGYYMANNKIDFRFVQFVGTNYEYNE